MRDRPRRKRIPSYERGVVRIWVYYVYSKYSHPAMSKEVFGFKRGFCSIPLNIYQNVHTANTYPSPYCMLTRFAFSSQSFFKLIWSLDKICIPYSSSQTSCFCLNLQQVLFFALDSILRSTLFVNARKSVGDELYIQLNPPKRNPG